MQLVLQTGSRLPIRSGTLSAIVAVGMALLLSGCKTFSSDGGMARSRSERLTGRC